MEFGKVKDTAELDRISWALPPDSPLNQTFLKSLPPQKIKIWMGAPAWNHKSWVGKIYPPNTKAADYLYHYSRYFNTIELNTTHYRIPSADQTKKWLEKVPSSFLFCPKIFNGISHSFKGLTDLSLLQEWFHFLDELGPHRGPSFLQLPPHFDYGYKALLFKFLQLWPERYSLALEFRHPSWFQNHQILPALTQYLQTRNIGLVITDVAGRQDVLHTSISSPFALIRFIGNELHPSDYKRADLWYERLSQWKQIGLHDVFFFVHEPDDTLVPEMTEHIRSLNFFQNDPPKG